MEPKSRIRREVMEKRDALSPEARTVKSREICRRLSESLLFRESDIIAGYSAIRSEVDLSSLLDFSLREGKALFLPKVSGDDMEFYRMNDLQNLAEGPFHVMEPRVDENVVSLPAFLKQLRSDSDVRVCVLTPGVAFSGKGLRIGYGKGYYDRYLPRLFGRGISIMTVGIGYELQVVDDFSGEKTDWKMNYIVTENREVCCDDGIGIVM